MLQLWHVWLWLVRGPTEAEARARIDGTAGAVSVGARTAVVVGASLVPEGANRCHHVFFAGRPARMLGWRMVRQMVPGSCGDLPRPVELSSPCGVVLGWVRTELRRNLAWALDTCAGSSPNNNFSAHTIPPQNKV